MAYFAISFLVFTLAAFGMALGSLLGGRPIKSGCGAVARLEDGRIRCMLCRHACHRAASAETGQCPGLEQGGHEQGGKHDAIS